MQSSSGACFLARLLLSPVGHPFSPSHFLGHCFGRILERPQLWDYFRSQDTLNAFWDLDQNVRAELFGPPMDLSAALTSFDPTAVSDEL